MVKPSTFENSPPPAGEVTGEVTKLLERLGAGDVGVFDELFPIVYRELLRIARGQRQRSSAGATLNTTELLHEAYLRFVEAGPQTYSHRQHFYAVAAKAMRQILLDEAKKRLRQKRGGGAKTAGFYPDQIKIDQQAELVIALDQSLKKLGRIKDRVRRVVEYRFFGGLTEEETAQLLGVDARTIRRDWAKAKVWLAMELEALGSSSSTS